MITIKFRTIFSLIILTILIVIGTRYGINIVKKQVYPLEYENYINKYSKEYNIDPFFIRSIIKVESKFDKDATSIKNARGLMQIATITGQWAAKELEIQNYDDDLLYDPETNIKIGCWYIDKLRTQFDNRLQLVIAAYNGGSGNVSNWLKNKEYSENGEQLNKIPFKETDDYVKKVMKTYNNYKELYR